MKNKLSLVIDGNYLMFQSFYATYRGDIDKIMRSSKGVPTNALSLFLFQLLKLLNYFEPTHLFVAFDSYSKTKRHELYEEYKSGRAKAPNELWEQFKLIKEILSKLKVNYLENPGDEADDLIATYCSKIDGEKVIFSRDKDLLQLVNSNTSVIEKSDWDYELIDIDNFVDNYGITPNQIPDYKGLRGDSSDNLKGVKGIGDKTAIKLLNEFTTLENLYENLESKSITNSVRNKLILDKDSAFFCKQLAILNKEVDVLNLDINAYDINLLDPSEAEEMLDDLELRKVSEYLEEWYDSLQL
ncbi:hypothetical protein VO56_00960 [Mycoplasmopsis gallinacea]|uniref:5'-3' exonuclease n=1 Tax=Mycoplasmopsis gallinacea TaxID=29556 RepID=A0A0D5ZIT8_9BACT|nr:hypothetical protein VO56_00960 [Mycoplasmopsis gallinacea]